MGTLQQGRIGSLNLLEALLVPEVRGQLQCLGHGRLLADQWVLHGRQLADHLVKRPVEPLKVGLNGVCELAHHAFDVALFHF